MAKGKLKRRQENPFAIVEDFAETVDALFLRYTGKTMQTLLKELGDRPRELSQGEKAMTTEEPDMTLDWAYSVLGLKPEASLEDVKKHYRNLARAFHSDKGSVMNDEAMKLLNRAYARITRGKDAGQT